MQNPDFLPAPVRVRLHKYLAACGVASRRASERLMQEGRVRVDGRVVTEPGTTIDPARQRIEVDGRPVRGGGFRWIAFYKPRGVVTTAQDPESRSTVYDYLKGIPERLVYVGRLDFDSEGLLLMTNDGELVNKLTHPRHHVTKVYRVWTGGEELDAAACTRLVRGVMDEEELLCAVDVTREAAHQYRVVLREGKKRQIRRMFAIVGARVRRLMRIAVGPVRIGALEPGQWRDLARDEVESLHEAAAQSGGLPPVRRRSSSMVSSTERPPSATSFSNQRCQSPRRGAADSNSSRIKRVIGAPPKK